MNNYIFFLVLTITMSKVLILDLFSPRIDGQNTDTNDQNGNNSYEGNKPGLIDDRGIVGQWIFWEVI